VPSFIIVNRATLILTPYRSQRDAAAIITREWQDGAHVVVDGFYDDAMSITFYTRRPTYLLSPNSGDLAFGSRRTSGSPLLLTSKQFDTWWWSAAPVFLLTDRRPFPAGSRVLLDRPRFSLVTNQPPTPRTPSHRLDAAPRRRPSSLPSLLCPSDRPTTLQAPPKEVRAC